MLHFDKAEVKHIIAYELCDHMDLVEVGWILSKDNDQVLLTEAELKTRSYSTHAAELTAVQNAMLTAWR